MAASKPTSPLSVSVHTLSPFTLNCDFGTLTIVWVVPLSVVELTPDDPSPAVYDDNPFGVGQGTEPFRAQNSKSVALRDYLSHARLD